MPRYYMTVYLEKTDEVEADTPEEAFEILSGNAMTGGSWDYEYDVIDDESEIDEESEGTPT